MDTLIPEQEQSKERLIPVKIIRRNKDVVLVEWIDESDLPKRAWVASAQIISEDVQAQKGRPSSGIARDPALGIPYGVEFARLISVLVTPQDIERELKRRGIWTINDLRADIPGVRAALQAAYGLTLADLLAAVKRYETAIRNADG